MPESDGLGFVAELRSRPRWAGIPVLVVSAMLHLEQTVRGQPIDGVVSKQFELDDLLRKVRELLPAR
jgi:CheY-like chemotaxis protein